MYVNTAYPKMIPHARNVYNIVNNVHEFDLNIKFDVSAKIFSAHLENAIQEINAELKKLDEKLVLALQNNSPEKMQKIYDETIQYWQNNVNSPFKNIKSTIADFHEFAKELPQICKKDLKKI